MPIAEIKAFLANPATPLIAFGIGCITLVWKFKMNASTANFAAICGVACLVAAVPFLTGINTLPYMVRTLWGSAALGIFGLGAYYLLWIPKAPLGVLATRPLVATKTLTVAGTTAWPNRCSEVRLVISNPSEQDYGNLDIKIGEGTCVGAFAQVTTVNNVSMWFHETAPTIDLGSLNIASGQTTEITRLVLTASQLGVRIRCGTLPRKSSIEIVLACITMIPNSKNGPTNSDYWMCLSFPAKDGGTNHAWYGYEKHSDDFFGQPPEVKNVKIEAQYETTKRSNKLTKTIDVFDEQKAVTEGIAKVAPKTPSMPDTAFPSNDGLKSSSVEKKDWATTTLEPVIGRSFTNERVEIDGKSFRKCRFENVTFNYRGIGRYEFIEVVLVKPIYLRSDNRAVSSFQELQMSFFKDPEFSSAKLTTYDSHGNERFTSEMGKDAVSKQPDSKTNDMNSNSQRLPSPGDTGH